MDKDYIDISNHISSKKIRCIAFSIDVFIEMILYWISSYLLINCNIHNSYIVLSICFINRVMITWLTNGQSIGKYITKIKIISVNKKRISLLKLILREIVLYFLHVIDILFIFYKNENLTAHDRLCDTYVINKERMKNDV